MKNLLFILVVLAGTLIISCTQKKKEDNDTFKKTAASTQMIIPVSTDTLLSNGRRNIFLVSRRELPGLFVERSIFPPAYRSNPHTHNGDLNMTVISGSINLVTGANLDSASNAHVYGPGSFIIIPANQPHFEWFTETTMIDITGIGPLNTVNLPIIHSTTK